MFLYLVFFKRMKWLNLTLIDVLDHADSKNDVGILHICVYLCIFGFFLNKLFSYKLCNTLTYVKYHLHEERRKTRVS